jgi:amidase
MSTSLDTIRLWAETVVRARHWTEDPKVLPIPWRDVELPQRLSIGIVYDDGLVTPHPPIQRGLREVVRALQEAGHEVVAFKPYDVVQGGELLKSFFAAGEAARAPSPLLAGQNG